VADRRGARGRAGPAGGRAAARPAASASGVCADYAPEEIAEIAQRLRKDAGLPDEPLGEVANGDEGLVDKVKDKLG
jgi:hypothetical protein